MKNVLLFSLVFSLIAIVSCKKETAENAIVVRDCTGTYLTVDGEDFYVCNFEKVESFPEGGKVEVTYKVVEECGLFGACLLYHAKAGDIEVLDIK